MVGENYRDVIFLFVVDDEIVRVFVVVEKFEGCGFNSIVEFVF